MNELNLTKKRGANLEILFSLFQTSTAEPEL